MKECEKNERSNRRQFLRRGVISAWFAGLCQAVGIWPSPARAAQPVAGLAGKALGPEFTYDLAQLRKVDPKLLQYRETGSLPLGLKESRGLVLDAEDNLYVAGDRAVVILDRNGKALGQVRLDDSPRCLSLGRDKSIFVGFKDHVEVYSPGGERRARWEKCGPKAVLAAIAVSENRVFVADAGSRMVHFYDLNGNLQKSLGKKTPGSQGPVFIIPSPYFDLAIGPGNLLWVANPGEHRLEVYTMDGEAEFSWGKYSLAIDGFCGCCNPVHFALLPDGRLVTSEKGLPRIKIYSARGEFECVVAEPEQFAKYLDTAAANPMGLDVAADSKGSILVLDSMSAAVRIFQHKARA